jgi:hypothetical protein
VSCGALSLVTLAKGKPRLVLIGGAALIGYLGIRTFSRRILN